MGILYVVGGLIAILAISIIFAMGLGLFNWSSSIITPELKGIGTIDNINVTQSVDIAINPINSFMASLNVLGVILFIFGILAIFGLAFVYRTTNAKWMIPLFFVLVVLLVICSIVMSQFYESYYTGTDDIAQQLQSQPAISWLILYSPGIFSIVSFLAGAVMFSAPGEETA